MPRLNELDGAVGALQRAKHPIDTITRVMPSSKDPLNPVTPEKITEVKIERTRPTPETWVFVRDKETGTWNITEPRAWRGNTTEITSLIDQILNAERDKSKDKPNTLADWGLEAPTETITLKRDKGDPLVRCKSVYAVHEVLSPGETETRAIAGRCKSGELGCAECKDMLVESIAGVLVPFQARRAELAGQDDYIRDILNEGARKARALIEPTVAEVREKMGLTQYG